MGFENKMDPRVSEGILRAEHESKLSITSGFQEKGGVEIPKNSVFGHF